MANANSAKSHYRRDGRSIVFPTLYSFQSHCRSLVLTGSCPEYPERAPKGALVAPRLVRVCASLVQWDCSGHLSGCLGDFVGSSPSLPSPPGPLYPGLPQSSLPVCTQLLSLLQELSAAVIWVHCGAAISSGLVSYFDCYVYHLSLSLSLLPPPPPLRRNPAFLSQRAPLGLPEPLTQFEQQGSSLAMTHLLAITANHKAHSVNPHTLTRSFDNPQFKSRLSSPSANCLLSAREAHLPVVVQGGRHTLYLCPTRLASSKSRTPDTLHRYTGARSDSKPGPLCLPLESSAKFSVILYVLNANPCCLRFYYTRHLSSAGC